MVLSSLPDVLDLKCRTEFKEGAMAKHMVQIPVEKKKKL